MTQEVTSSGPKQLGDEDMTLLNIGFSEDSKFGVSERCSPDSLHSILMKNKGLHRCCPNKLAVTPKAYDQCRWIQKRIMD